MFIVMRVMFDDAAGRPWGEHFWDQETGAEVMCRCKNPDGSMEEMPHGNTSFSDAIMLAEKHKSTGAVVYALSELPALNEVIELPVRQHGNDNLFAKARPSYIPESIAQRMRGCDPRNN